VERRVSNHLLGRQILAAIESLCADLDGAIRDPDKLTRIEQPLGIAAAVTRETSSRACRRIGSRRPLSPRRQRPCGTGCAATLSRSPASHVHEEVAHACADWNRRGIMELAAVLMCAAALLGAFLQFSDPRTW